MAIITRTRKNGSAVYSVHLKEGRQVWERLEGTDAREHGRADKRIKKQIEAGIHVGKLSSAMTIGTFAKQWFRQRTNRSAANEERLFEMHVQDRSPWFCMLKLEDVRAAHVLRLIDELGRPYERNGATVKLSPKSIFLVFSVVRTMCRNARAHEIMFRDPCFLPEGKDGKGKLSKKGKIRQPYTADEVRAILTCKTLDEDERIFCALAFFTGMREGEIAGRRFRDYDRNPEPLGALMVTTQYDDQPLKTADADTDAPRVVPVHPGLAEFLDAWQTKGFEMIHCRPPTADDFIIPCRGYDKIGRPDTRRGGRNHSKSSAYKLFRRALAKAGVVAHSLHSTRHTFVTLARRDGARKDVVERITHNASAEIVDVYTHFEWDPLCEAVSCFMSKPRPAPRQLRAV